MDRIGSISLVNTLSTLFMTVFWYIVFLTIFSWILLAVMRIVAGLLKEKTEMRVCRILIWSAISFWLLPLIFLYWLLREGSHGAHRLMMFNLSVKLLPVMTVFLLAFFIRLVCILRVRVKKHRSHEMMVRLFPDCTDMARQAMPARLRRLMGRRVRVCVVDTLTTPFSAGIFRPVIFLPCGSLSEQEMVIALTHELTHIRHCDCQLKCLVEFFSCFLLRRRSADFLMDEVNRVNEHCCDLSSIRRIGCSREDYFSRIRAMAVRLGRMRESAVESALLSEAIDLTERERIVMKEEKRTRNRTGAAVLSVAAGAAAWLCAFSVSFGAVTGYDFILDTDVRRVTENVQTGDYSWDEYVNSPEQILASEAEETVLTGPFEVFPGPNVFPIQQLGEDYVNTIYEFTRSNEAISVANPDGDRAYINAVFSVPDGEEYLYGPFYLTAGQALTITWNSNVSVAVGIKSNQIMRTYPGAVQTHVFQIYTSNSYYIVIVNNSGQTASGYFGATVN